MAASLVVIAAPIALISAFVGFGVAYYYTEKMGESIGTAILVSYKIVRKPLCLPTSYWADLTGASNVDKHRSWVKHCKL